MATELAHFREEEWSFDYPSAWRYEPARFVAPSGYALLGYLGTTPVDTSKICQTTPTGGNCDPHRYDLPPGNVVITISTEGGPMFAHTDQGTSTQVGGMAAILSEAQEVADRVLLTWKIADPMADNNWIQLDADIRGPGLDALRAQVEALIASFGFTPTPTPSAPGG